MGKKTLYHPVSLHVIRGAAEYCGFQFGKLKQMWSQPEELSARYEVTIQQIPPRFQDKSNSIIQEALQNCFMDDIRVHWVHNTKSGVLACFLQVQINKKATLEEIAEDLIAEHSIAGDIPF